MKGKLIKMGEGYIFSPTGDVDDIYAMNQELAKDNGLKTLSLKNCQAIERGYDLDDLAKINSLSYTWLENNERDKMLMSKYGIEGFKAGFQKALEILGDKKFSEKELKRAYHLGKISKDKHQIGMSTQPSEILVQSLQQNEWDVEIEQVMVSSSIEGEGEWKNKLDGNGCLILNRL